MNAVKSRERKDPAAERAIESVLAEAVQITDNRETAFDELIDHVGDARFVLLGEASHGTHEFYAERARITQRLIEEKGFNAVAVEADFPDAFRVNRYVRGGDDPDADMALSGFSRFPQWMWRNREVLAFVDWLREYNDRNEEKKAGFYGLDLYSLHASIDAVLGYLEKTDPEAAARARSRYSCFDHFGEDTQAYGYAAAFGLAESCEDEVVKQLIDVNRRASELYTKSSTVARDEMFFAVQNARLVRNAETYYRTMYRSDVSSWNVRDRHMMESLSELEAHLSDQPSLPKIVVWAHNSHLGDARFTDMGRRGELNVGQLVRQKYRDEAVLIGFTTHSGTVTAATDWGGDAERKRVRPSLPGSVENVFHDSGLGRFVVITGRESRARESLKTHFLERAIGVIYRPETERQSHYFNARISQQFDAVIHLDETRALEPLEITPLWETGEPPETFPSGL